jgi:hypothetical protein
MKTSRYTLLFLMAASLVLSAFYCPPFDLGISDKEIFTYTGWAISKGLVPYRDFVDHKPPLIYFVHFAGIASGGPWGLWVINAGLALLATALFFHCCRRHDTPFPWLPPLLFNLMLRDNLISEGINMTREYTAFLYLFFFCTLRSRTRYRHFLLGLLTGLTFFMQQDQAPALIPFLFYALFTIDPVPAGRRIAWLTAGFLSILLPLVTWFALHHALGDLWRQAFLFNWQTYTTQRKSFGDHFRSVKRVLDNGNYEIAFMVSLVLGFTALIGRSRKKGLIVAALAGMLLTMTPEFLGGRWNGFDSAIDYIYYFLPLSAGIAVLLFTVLAFDDENIVHRPMARLPLVVLLCASLTYTAFQHGSHLLRRSDDPVINSPELNYLRQHRPDNFQLYVFQQDDYIAAYYEFHILSPSRFIYQHFWSWYDNWDPDGSQLRTVCDDLGRHHTTYIITDADRTPSFRNPRNRTLWLSFLTSHYEPVPMPDSHRSLLWKIKSQP